MHKEYLTVSNIVGPLVIVEKISDVKYNELVEIEDSAGHLRRGTVLEVSTDQAVVQVFEGTVGLDIDKSRVRFLGRSQQLPVSEELSAGCLTAPAGRAITVRKLSPADDWTSTAVPSTPTPAIIRLSSSRRVFPPLTV